jgi:hypothetical protein
LFHDEIPLVVDDKQAGKARTNDDLTEPTKTPRQLLQPKKTIRQLSA